MYAKNYQYCSPAFVAMAHRGGAEWGPNLGKENTHHAFAQAVSLGYRYIETDLQVTRDGRLVCFHDDTLDRVTGVPGRVRDFTASELSEITVGGEPIPFFDEVLRTFPEVCFNVDLKTDDAVVPLTKAIHVFGVQDRILVDSFSQTRISRFRALTHGTIPTAMAPVGVAWTAFVPVLSTIISSPAIAIQVPIREKIGPVTIQVISAETIERVHRIGKVIHAWTINDPQEMETLIDWGIDGIITDRPDLLKEILVRRNLWSTNE